MEHWFQQRLQISLDHHLGDSVGDRRNTQRPRSTIAFRDVHPSDRRRHIAARRHSIPEPIEIIIQILLELRDRLIVNARRPAVFLHSLVRHPHFALGNIKMVLLYPCGSSPFGLPTRQSRTTPLLRSSPITGPSSLLRAAPPLCPASVLSPLRSPSA